VSQVTEVTRIHILEGARKKTKTTAFGEKLKHLHLQIILAIKSHQKFWGIHIS